MRKSSHGHRTKETPGFETRRARAPGQQPDAPANTEKISKTRSRGTTDRGEHTAVPPARTVRWDRSATLTAVAYATPPIGRCRRWVVIVPRCPACGYAHVHRDTGAHGGRRTGSCGATYRLVITGRRRGAA